MGLIRFRKLLLSTRIDRLIAILKITFLPRVKVRRICALPNIPFVKTVLKIASLTCIFLHEVTSCTTTRFRKVEIKISEDLDPEPNRELPQHFYLFTSWYVAES